MATYTYKSTDMSGSRVNGVINSTSESSAINSLSKRGLMVLSINPVKDKSGVFNLFPLKLLDLMTFSRQLAIMLNSGVNLAAGLEVLAEQEVFSPRFRKIIASLLANIESGMSFAEALKNEKGFDDIFINLVDAGENSGSLENTLDKIAQFYESQKKLKDEVKSATTYPMFILVFGILMVIVVMFFILPKLAESFGGTPTGIMGSLMDLNVFLTENWLLVTIALIAAAVGLFFFFMSTAGKNTISYVLGI